ncbi:MAG: hypothetical protein BJ554DRAFT_148, partial [Olpidium bornovanus]
AEGEQLLRCRAHRAPPPGAPGGRTGRAHRATAARGEAGHTSVSQRSGKQAWWRKSLNIDEFPTQWREGGHRMAPGGSKSVRGGAAGGRRRRDGRTPDGTWRKRGSWRWHGGQPKEAQQVAEKGETGGHLMAEAVGGGVAGGRRRRDRRAPDGASASGRSEAAKGGKGKVSGRFDGHIKAKSLQVLQRAHGNKVSMGDKGITESASVVTSQSVEECFNRLFEEKHLRYGVKTMGVEKTGSTTSTSNLCCAPYHSTRKRENSSNSIHFTPNLITCHPQNGSMWKILKLSTLIILDECYQRKPKRCQK